MIILVIERGTHGLCSVLEMGESHVFHRPFHTQVETWTGKPSPCRPSVRSARFLPDEAKGQTENSGNAKPKAEAVN